MTTNEDPACALNNLIPSRQDEVFRRNSGAIYGQLGLATDAEIAALTGPTQRGDPRAETWIQKNWDAIQDSNEYVERQGLPLAAKGARSPYARVPRLYRFLFRRTRVERLPRGTVQRTKPRPCAPGPRVSALPFNPLHARRTRRNARLLSRKWAGRSEPARALYWRLHLDQTKPSYTLAELLAQMPDGPMPRLPDWEAATPVGREILPEYRA